MSLHRLLISSFLVFSFTMSSLVAQETSEEGIWTPELSMKLKSIQGTDISPDGKLIAYVVREPVMEGKKSEYLSQIWLVSADGSSNLQYTFGEKSASSPSFSPDGKFLAFTTSRSDTNQVWIMRVMGGEARQLTNAKTGVVSFEWSPDGKRIAYTMQDPETKEEKKQKKEKRDVILVDKNFKYSHLYTVAIAADDSGRHKLQRLTRGDFHVSSFNWSPDGSMIVFTHQPDPRINTRMNGSDISVVSSDSGAVKPLVTWPGADSNPIYSPNGQWIAFSSNGGTIERIGLRDVFMIPSGGGAPGKLAETPDRNAGIIDWSADSKRILLMETVHTSRHILALPVDGKAPIQLSRGDGVIGGVSLAAGANRMSFVFQDLTTPADVYVSPISSFSKTRLTNLHKDLELPPMARTELLTWTSSDGLKIEGLLTYPIHYQSGRSYPLILNIHGGPAGAYTQGFTGNPSIYMIQYFAQNGYAILRGNPRGSSGYGKEFRYANFKDWGFGDYNDVMSGVDKVVDMGVAHPDSLCLMGWSYGGYMTSYVVTKTGRFKAASMGAGLPNLVSMVSTTDIPDYLVAHMGSEFWEDYETYEKHSAIYRIKNVTTPTQVIHGANDLRVPFTQGQEFYTALSRLGVPTEMIVYPRTPHGPREPKFIMDVSPRILTWFEHHLGKPQKAKEMPSTSLDE